MCIYVAIQRQAVATLSHLRFSKLLRVILAFLVLLVSTHFNGRHFARKGEMCIARHLSRKIGTSFWSCTSMYTPCKDNPMFAVTCRTLHILTVDGFARKGEMCIYVAILRQAVATLSHLRFSKLLRVFLAFLVLLVSTHFNGKLRGL